ncbi:HK97 family phage prohead protease [Actinoplanes sp. NPDC026623]|uniref:HK97 family phage prohead protease n=1 Tax=Actinoplanes sp. NPDC026623 TaxID=3155610 RepID=UPI0033FE42D6
MKHKTMPAVVTAPDDGVFEAVVSVFNNKDLGGDIVRPGAFRKSLDRWAKSGSPIPVYWSHRTDDPSMNIGAVLEARELKGGSMPIPDWANDWIKRNGGLYVKARLDDFGQAAQVRHLMRNRRVQQFSFSYDVVREQRTGEGNELLELDLHEVGPTPLAMNPMTELISAKQATGDPVPSTDRLSRAAFLAYARLLG